MVPASAPRIEAVGEGRSVRRRQAAGWNVIFFVLGLAAWECLINAVGSPFQSAEKVERKFAYFAAHKDEYDCVFVGSSRVMNQLSPAVFDAQMAAAGRPCRSFNLGMAAMFLPECSFLVDQVRALHPKRLRGMVIELSSPAPRHDLEHPLTERDIYWHHLAPTLLACAAVWTDPDARGSLADRATQTWLQTTIFARCAVHLGYGPGLLERVRKSVLRRDDAPTLGRDALGPTRDGFIPLPHTLGQGEDGVAKTGGGPTDQAVFQSNVEKLRASKSATRAGEVPHVPTLIRAAATATLRRLLAGQATSLAKEGIAPYFFIGPGTSREQSFVDLHAEGTVPKLAAFNDPDAMPDLYALAVRADRNHLNAEGAEQLSRRLALILAADGFPPLRQPSR